ncbi:uncharacterized protein LOC122088166 [Macadamia integrifolia]|uniref:uncharacterized protein LOC122088166 n=1 Tax=Macadamia integrifolia TaxID=60698 RepID=UPI001C4F3455|nr:uncharacterized protein LOC122088166 [Macadamia integrifolia]
MPNIGQDYSPRFSVDGVLAGSPTFTPLCSNVGTLRSFSYLKLPQQLFKLSILKLDGSSFDVQVAGTASVDELKQAIEDSFNLSPKEGQGKISWSHVWGHFCLCFEGQKLLNDKAYIRSFGIKDGDQLCFIRHLSINYNPVKNSKSCTDYEQETSFSSGSDSLEEKELHGEEGEDYNACCGDQEGKDKYSRNEDGESQDFICHTEFKLAHFLRGWLSYSRLWSRGNLRTRSKSLSSRFAGDYLRVGAKETLL